jgi:hypothetical protein
MTSPHHEPSPDAELMNLLTARFISRGIASAAELGLADHLEAGARTSGDVARALGADAPSLYRLMRMLAMAGVLVERDDGAFALTPVGACLRKSAPGSLAPMARFLGERSHDAAWAELTHSVRTGESGFRRAHGMRTFEWLAQHPDAATVFDDAMSSVTSTAAAAITAAYDFSPYRVIADVGGGQGRLLAEILEATPGARGVLFDRPQVVEEARRRLADHGLAARCAICAGDFFEAVPPGCDAYVLKNVLHDWDDESAAKILGNCAARLDEAGRVLVVEQGLTRPGVPSLAKVLDVEMLIMTDGGRERTDAEYAALFAASGLRLARVVPTESPMQILEAVRA